MAGRSVLLLSGIVMVLAAGPSAASKRQPPIAIAVGPAISFEPADIRITSRVEPNVANRALQLEVDSGSHYSSSVLQLEGENGPRSHSTVLKNLPAGEYQVVATLRTENGVSSVARQRFQVFSGRGDSQ